MAGMARWCFRRRWTVIGLWFAALVALGFISQAAGTAYLDDFALAGTDSTRALDLLKTAMPEQAGETDTIVWHVDAGTVNDPAIRQQISSMLDKVAHAPSITAVTSPYTPEGATQISADQHTAYASIVWNGVSGQDPADVTRVIAIAQAARTSNIQVELGGVSIQAANQASTNASALIGLIAAAVILLLAFGSLFSMLLPLVSAIFSIALGMLTIGLLSHAVTIATVGPLFATLVGLGVGVDYALFIVTRHRNGLKAGLSVEESAVRAINTAGRAVLFAGATVCIALLGLLVLGLGFLTGIGVAASVMVLFTMLAAVTLLPAMLRLLGMRVLSRRERRRLAEQGSHDDNSTGRWARWSEYVSRSPRMLAGLAILVIAVLTIPFFSMRLGTSDQGNDPAGTTTRKAYDLLAQGFGAGFNGQLQLVAEVPSPADQQALASLVRAVEQTPGVATAFAVPMRPGATVGVVQIIPTTTPQDVKTTELINRLRTDVIPAAERGTNLKVYVGGLTGVFTDFADVLSGKLLPFIAVIVSLGFLLLLLAFRSLVVPLTAAVMNLLAAGAAFGVVVGFFQFGWGSDAMGLGGEGPVDVFLPVLMLAVLFGLAMDYQVFLVSRMHEAWVHTRDNRTAVVVGQSSTGRVITAAAAIMICVFMVFVFGGQRVVAEFGVGLASAVFIDAFILRTVLVPALMHMFGPANWWLPTWIDRWLPHLSVEAADTPSTDDESAPHLSTRTV